MYNISANTIFTGKRVVYLPTCHSTNEYASQLLTEERPLEGTLIITPEQTAGKGQRGNRWEAEAGKNLTFSLILLPHFLPVHHQFYLNIITALAVRDTVAHFLQTSVKVKWPNDIYLNDKKIAGILIQNSLRKNTLNTSVVGIGLNVNQQFFTDKKAVSMSNFAHASFSLEQVLDLLLEKTEAYYLKLRDGHMETLRQTYLSHLFRIREEHDFIAQEIPFRGTISGLDDSGRLLISTPEGERAFNFKEVEFVW